MPLGMLLPVLGGARSGTSGRGDTCSSFPQVGVWPEVPENVVAGWVLIGIGVVVAVPKGNLRTTTAQVVGLVAGLAAVVAGIVLVVG